MKKNIYPASVLLAGGFWATSCLFVNAFAGFGISSQECTAIRMVTAALFLHIIMLIKGRGLRHYRIGWKNLLLAALTGAGAVLFTSYFYYISISMTSAAVSAILLYTAPFFVMLLSLLLFGEQMSVKKLASFLIALIGCGLVSGIAGGVIWNGLGLLFGVLSGIAYALYSIFTAIYLRRGGEDPFAFMSFSITFAAIGSLLLISPGAIVEKVAAAPMPTIPILLGLGFGFATAAVPYLLYTFGLSGIRASVASILAFSEPLMAALFGLVFLHEKIDAFGVIGILLVTAAIVIMNITPKKKEEKTEGAD